MQPSLNERARQAREDPAQLDELIRAQKPLMIAAVRFHMHSVRDEYLQIAEDAVREAMVLLLMLGLGAYRIFSPRSDLPLEAPADAREPLRLVTPTAPQPNPTSAAPDPSPSATAALPAESFQGRKFCPLCRADDHVLDDHCEYCSEIGHDEDDCPYAPPGWDDDKYNYCPLCRVEGHVLDDHCEYCGGIGHDDDDCPYAPPGWDDD